MTNLFALAICRVVNLSLEHGNSDASCAAPMSAGRLHRRRRISATIEAGFRFGQLGYDLVEQRGLKRFQARTYMFFGNLVMPWTRHVRDRPRSGASRLRGRECRSATSHSRPIAATA